jgi:hypothetical protein
LSGHSKGIVKLFDINVAGDKYMVKYIISINLDFGSENLEAKKKITNIFNRCIKLGCQFACIRLLQFVYLLKWFKKV